MGPRISMKGSGSSSSTFTMVFDVPYALGDENRRGHRRHARRVADGLGLHFAVAVGMVADVVDEKLDVVVVLLPFNQVADAGLARIVRRERRRVRQHRLEHLERDNFHAFGRLDRHVGGKAEFGEDREYVDVMVAKAHPEADAVGVDVFRQRMQLVVAGEIEGLLAHHRELVAPS